MELLPIESYLPQKRPFIMVDSIVSADATACQTTLKIEESNVLFKNGHFTEAGILENIAQSSAAHIGYIEIHIRKNPKIRIGLVTSYNKIQITRLPLAGEVLMTQVTESQNYGELTIYEAEVKCGDECIAKGEIRVVLTEQIS